MDSKFLYIFICKKYPRYWHVKTAYNVKDYEGYRSTRVYTTGPCHQHKDILEDMEYASGQKKWVHTVIKTNIGWKKRSIQNTEIQGCTGQGLVIKKLETRNKEYKEYIIQGCS